MMPEIRDKLYCITPPVQSRSESSKQRLRDILKSKTGFIHLVNTYEEKRLSTYIKLLKKEAYDKALEDFLRKKFEKEGDLVAGNYSFNPYRKKHPQISSQGDLEYDIDLSSGQPSPRF
mmetsp:Transcript_19551/g.17305  ORF Transcript_19551/g.17305 Transcript_19551/m.17305 type:complete len:118 (-) Transcript_19551:1-354(-)